MRWLIPALLLLSACTSTASGEWNSMAYNGSSVAHVTNVQSLVSPGIN